MLERERKKSLDALKKAKEKKRAIKRKLEQREREVNQKKRLKEFLQKRMELACSALDKLSYLEIRGGEYANHAQDLLKVIEQRKKSMTKRESKENVFNGYAYWRADIATLNIRLGTQRIGKLTFEEVKALFYEY